MSYQSVFKRYELKFLLTNEQKNTILQAMKPYMQIDRYGRSTVRNLYFDTEDYLLIRRSIEKPVYKEKLRLRSYCKAEKESLVFVELKKKYKSVVYKRRVSMNEQGAMEWITNKHHCLNGNQIAEEINYFLEFYKGLRPVLFISYEREAFYAVDGSDFRVTFDHNILCRQDLLTLDSDAYGIPILPKDTVLMEVKCSGGMPLWMTGVLSKERIFKTSYSKYGTAYKTIIFPKVYGAKAQNGEVIIYD